MCYRTRIKGTLREDQYTFSIISRSFLLRMRKCFRQNLQRISKHILCSVTFSENLALYEIMWTHFVQRSSPQMTVWRMRIACWVPKATNTHTHTHRLCNTHLLLSTTMAARMNFTLHHTYTRIYCPVERMST